MTELPRLPRRAEALLDALHDDAELDWDAQAGRIRETLASIAIGSTDDSLLEPPQLWAEPGEPTEAQEQPREETANPLSLAELARSVAQKPARTANDALVKQSLAVAAAARAQAPAPRLPVPREAVATPASPVPREPALTHVPARGSTRSFLAGAGVAIAAAAVMALVMRPMSKEAPAPATAAVEESAPQAREPRIAQEAPHAAKPVEAGDAGAAPPRSEPPAEEAAGVEAPQKLALNELAPARRSAAAPPPVAAPKRARASEPVVLEDAAPEPRPGRAEGDTPSAQAKPASPAKPAQALRPASGTASTTIADRPSTGAAQAAIGSVLGAARACVAGLSGASTASVVFNSEGSVSKVTLSGPAAGTPAGGCVESALRRARVAPFSQPTYVVSGIAIRP